MSNRWRKNSKRARWDQSRPSLKRGSRASLEGSILFTIFETEDLLERLGHGDDLGEGENERVWRQLL